MWLRCQHNLLIFLNMLCRLLSFQNSKKTSNLIKRFPFGLQLHKNTLGAHINLEKCSAKIGWNWKKVQTYFSFLLSARRFITVSTKRFTEPNLHKTVANCLNSNISSVVEFLRWWVLKSKIFGQKSIYSKEIIVFWEYGERQFVKNWAWF